MKDKWLIFANIMILVVCSFFINYYLEKKLDHLQVFSQHNVMFDADPSFRLKNFQYGLGPGGHEWVHPNLSNFVHPPIRALASVLYHSGLIKTHPNDIRRDIIIFLLPVLGALKTLILFIFFYKWGFDILSTVILCLLEMLSFSRLMFNSMPEHFAITGFLLALLFLLALTSLQKEKLYTPLWVILGTLIAGITLSNIAVVMILWGLVVYQIRYSFKTALKFTTYMAIFILIFNMGYALLVNTFILPKEKSILDGTKHELFIAHTFSEASNKFQEFTQTLTNAFVTPEPDIDYNSGALAYNPDAKYDITFSMQDNINPLIIIRVILLLMMMIGMLVLFRDPNSQFLLLAALLVLIFNWIFHSVYGKELFLYSQHWILSEIILFAGIFRLKSKFRIASIVISSIFIIIMAIQNITVIKFMLDVLATY